MAVTWKNIQYANTAGLVDSIRANNAQATKARQSITDALQGAGDDYTKRQTDAFNNAVQMAQSPEDINKLMANKDDSWLNLADVNTALQDRTKEFRDITTHEDTRATNALRRKTDTQTLLDAQIKADRLQVTQGRTDDAYDIEQRKIAETDAMRLLMAHPTSNDAVQLQNIAAFGQASGVADDVYRDALNTKRLAQARQAMEPFEDIDAVTEQEAIDYSNEINNWVDANMPLASAPEKAAAVGEMTAATGLDNILARIKATRERKAEEALIDFKHIKDKEIEQIKADNKKDTAWIKNNSSGKGSKGKSKMLDRLAGMPFATEDFLYAGESPGTNLMRKLTPIIEVNYPNVKDQDKIWNYLATSGFPTPDESGRNSFIIGGIDVRSDAFNEATLKAYINKSGVLNVKPKK